MASGFLEGAAVNAVGNVVSNGLIHSYSHIRAKFASSRNLDENYKQLINEKRSLLATKEYVDAEARTHRQKRRTTYVYSIWINKVSATVAEVEQLTGKYERKRLQRFRIQQRSRLSEKMAKMCSKVVQLTEEGRLPTGFLEGKLAEAIIEVRHTHDIEGYPTLKSSLEMILRLLRKNRIRGIGVCGIAGVGKTTILQNLNNNKEVAVLFDIVIFVKVSAEQRDQKLQKSIAKRLLLDIEGIDDDNMIAGLISEELKDKKYLLILDEVVDYINLNQLGIQNNDNGSKVVLATRFRYVCKLSNVNIVIEVKQLSPNEAWKMFKGIVGDVIDYPDIEENAQLVSSKCSSLPLVIKVIASSFKLKDTAESWRDGIEDLNKLWPAIQSQGLKELYSFLRFCYDELEDEKQKKCFLYGSLYPADSKIFTDYLVECWAAEGFLGDVNDTRKYQNARDRGYAILEHLINVSLLEKGKRIKDVRMSNFIRELALHISSEDPECNFFVKDSEESAELTTSQAWEQAKRVSMIHSGLHVLPENPSCNNLFTLLLQKNSNLAKIPPNFFEHMSGLLVLDLHRTEIGKLPSSLSKLTSLKGLYLNECKFLTLLPPEIASLQFLEVLDIRGSTVKFIPFHIQNLVNLRCLRISYVKNSDGTESQGQKTDSNVIAMLQKLEELVIEVDSYNHWCNGIADVIHQVASLKNLSTLRFCFPDSDSLTDFITNNSQWKNRKLNAFQFFVGCKNSKLRILESFEHRITRYMKYYNGRSEDDSTIKEVLAETDAFELICHNSVTKLSDFLEAASLKRIRGWSIESCNSLSTIIDSSFVPLSNSIVGNNMTTLGNNIDYNDSASNGSILPNLEQLYLKRLLNLESVFDCPMQPRSLSKLQILEIMNCPKLTRIFNDEAICQLSRLQKLTIKVCFEIEELVLPKLETLVLNDMPKLKNICINKSLAWPSSLEVLKISSCPQLKSLPFRKENATSLRFIRGEQDWWNEMDWATTDDDDIKWLQSIFVPQIQIL